MEEKRILDRSSELSEMSMSLKIRAPCESARKMLPSSSAASVLAEDLGEIVKIISRGQQRERTIRAAV